MAPIKGNILKKLFGKLTPYADDVARGVSNYGDEALQLTPSAAGNRLFNMAGVADGNGYTADQLFNKLRVAAESSANPDTYAETLNDLYKYTNAYDLADGWIATDDIPWWQQIVQKRNRKPISGLNYPAKYASSYSDDIAKGFGNSDAFIRPALPHDAHVNAYRASRKRNEAAAYNILENAATMRLNASDATADALTRLNRKYPAVFDNFYDIDDHIGYLDLAVGPFTNVVGYVDDSPVVAHAGNRKLKALYEKLGLDRYGYEPDELPF